MAYRPQVKTSNGMVDLPIDAETIKGKTLLEQTYPVNSIYMSVSSTSPASLFGGTWERLKDRFLLGAGDTYSNGATGGEATHVLTTDEIPTHSHDIETYRQYNTGSSTDSTKIGRTQSNADGGTSNISTRTQGSGQAHNNMPPYLVVYMWKRTA